LKTLFTDRRTTNNDEVLPASSPSHAEPLDRESASAVVRWLDRTIVLLMVAIVLTLSWPVGQALWPSRHSATPTFTQENFNDREHRGVQSPKQPLASEIARFTPLTDEASF
jgi:hypothetical protein